MCTEEDCFDEEELQFEYEQECDRVQELKNELKGAKLEVQQLRMRLKACSVDPARCGGIPGGASAVLPGVMHEDSRDAELANFVMWLAENVELEQKESFNVGFEVPIGGTTVHLQDIVQWPLKLVPGRRLRISVPVQWEDDFRMLLETTKRDGMVNFKLLNANPWELIPGEITTMKQMASEPAVLLARKGSCLGVLVATWPTPQSLEAFHALCTIDDWMPTLGDRVEVEYDGDWYLGTLHSLDATGKASVSCDVDAPGVLTLAPMHRLRRIGASTAAPDQPATPPPEASTGASTAASSTADAELPICRQRASSSTDSPSDRAAELSEQRRLLRQEGLDLEKPAVDPEPGSSRRGQHRRTRSAM